MARYQITGPGSGAVNARESNDLIHALWIALLCLDEAPPGSETMLTDTVTGRAYVGIQIRQLATHIPGRRS